MVICSKGTCVLIVSISRYLRERIIDIQDTKPISTTPIPTAHKPKFGDSVAWTRAVVHETEKHPEIVNLPELHSSRPGIGSSVDCLGIDQRISRCGPPQANIK